jgi:hypothetical protein
MENKFVEKLLFQSPPILRVCLFILSQLDGGLPADVLCLLYHKPVRKGRRK